MSRPVGEMGRAVRRLKPHAIQTCNSVRGGIWCRCLNTVGRVHAVSDGHWWPTREAIDRRIEVPSLSSQVHDASRKEAGQRQVRTCGLMSLNARQTSSSCLRVTRPFERSQWNEMGVVGIGWTCSVALQPRIFMVMYHLSRIDAMQLRPEKFRGA
jgi:hypothetical protein